MPFDLGRRMRVDPPTLRYGIQPPTRPGGGNGPTVVNVIINVAPPAPRSSGCARAFISIMVILLAFMG